MNHHPEYYIMAAALIGVLLGFLIGRLSARRKIRTIEKDTWAEASTFYRHRYALKD